MTDGRGPRVHNYGNGEFMLAYGPMSGPQVIVLQPFFEEMNRCRALVADICRQLGDRGIGCWLPDLPGTGESLCAIEDIGWEDWRTAVVDAASVVMEMTGTAPIALSIRGGALLDDAIPGMRWRLSQTTGRSLVSDLRRSALASGGDPKRPAGYPLAPALMGALEAADVTEGARARTVRLASDDRPADHRIAGAPIWRRPEPQTDPALAAAIVADVAGWLGR